MFTLHSPLFQIITVVQTHKLLCLFAELMLLYGSLIAYIVLHCTLLCLSFLFIFLLSHVSMLMYAERDIALENTSVRLSVRL